MPRSLLVTGGAGFIGTNFIHYGPFQFPEKLFPLMIVNALAGRRMPVYGDGLNVRDLEEGFGERWGGISITRNGGAGYWTAAIRNGSGTITVLPCPSDPYVIHLRPLGLAAPALWTYLMRPMLGADFVLALGAVSAGGGA